MGISIEEAAEDLKTTVVQLLNIEDGNINGFQDVSSLKYFVRDYAKYLGIKTEDIMDEFNEYLFDYTSKLSIEDIKKARKSEVKDETEKRIVSPYTLEYKKKKYISARLFILVIAILLAILSFFLFKYFWK